jgi:aubergine-like protein
VNNIVNVMSKKLLRRQGLILLGRSYFLKDPIPITARGAEPIKLYPGFTVSVQPARLGNLMTVDSVSRVVRQKNVRQMLNEWWRDFVTQQKQQSALPTDAEGKRAAVAKYQELCKQRLVGSTVLCVYNHRAWRIDDIDFTKSMVSTFERETGDTVTFREYFANKYQLGTSLPDPESQNDGEKKAAHKRGLLVNIPRRAGTTKQTTLLLPELCFLTGLDDKMRSSQGLMKELNRHTRLPPSQRVDKIKMLLERVCAHSEAKAPVAEGDRKVEPLPIRLGSIPVTVKGRVLPPFELLTKGRKGRIDPTRGGGNFQRDIFKSGYFGGQVHIPAFGLVFEANQRRTAERVSNEFKQRARQQGAVLGGCLPGEAKTAPGGKSAEPWQNAIDSVLASAQEKKVECKFIIVLVPSAHGNPDSFVYSVVKHHCSVQRGIVSQVILPAGLAGNQGNNILNNCVKQVLAKLAHQNWRIDIGRFLPAAAKTEGTMFVGVDVSHDKLLKGVFGGSRDRRSTVGFVATRDATFHAYNSYISYQSPDTEFLTEAKRLMKTALMDYASENNSNFPGHICVYRDGVGDSQLATFVRREIQFYEQAFNELGISPKLTVIVVQKRVNLRLFSHCPRFHQTGSCSDRRCNGRDAYHSPASGTVVDEDISSQMLSDFYLIPSIAPPGACARPTRFVILRDDMGLTADADKLQSMTNQMCYMYYNWPGPIRVPAIVMYAHKCSFLFGKNATGTPNDKIKGCLHYL